MGKVIGKAEPPEYDLTGIRVKIHLTDEAAAEFMAWQKKMEQETLLTGYSHEESCKRKSRGDRFQAWVERHPVLVPCIVSVVTSVVTSRWVYPWLLQLLRR